MRFGIVGYGPGGRFYHAPFIEAASQEIVGVVTRNPERRAQVAKELPGTKAVDSLEDLLALGVDAVTITTPPHTHHDLVIKALRAGVPVVADKPFAPDEAGARELIKVSKETGTPLSIYQDRRWDGDLLTVKDLIDRDQLGKIMRLHFTFDLDEAWSLETGPNGGVLRDLGAHVVDQALLLLGPATRVFAQLDEVPVSHIEGARAADQGQCGANADLGHTADPERTVDAGFTLELEHTSGARSFLSASKIYHKARRQWRVYGSRGSFDLSSRDVQAQDLLAGKRPISTSDWGRDTEAHWGTLATNAGTETIPTKAGNYTDFYRQFALAIETGGEVPVTPESALQTVIVLDAARRSAETHQPVDIGD